MEFINDDPICYDRWIEDALRSVIYKALAFTADNGLVEGHYFYITFRTNNNIINIPQKLKIQHPEEMTIVLQNRFENLDVKNDRFSVTLRFDGTPVTLEIPFSEITAFTDPSVNFGLQLKTTEIDDEEFEDMEYANVPPNEDLEYDTFKHFSSHSAVQADSDVNGQKKSNDGKTTKKASNVTGEVIALETYRKK